MSQDKKVIVRCAKGDIEDFKNSILWKDIKRELGMWRRGFNHEQERIVDEIAEDNKSTAAVLTHIGSIDGRRKAVDFLLQLPDMFLQILEDQKDDTECE